MKLVQTQQALRIFRHSPNLTCRRIRDKILVMRPTGVGALIVAMPLLRHLRFLFPSHRISLLATPCAVELFKHCTDIDELLVPDHDGETSGYERILPSLRAMHFDAFFCPQHSEAAAALGLALEIPVRVGFKHGENGAYFTHRTEECPELSQPQRMLHLLDPFETSVAERDRRLPIFTSAEDVGAAFRFLRAQGVGPDERCVGLGVGGPAHARWPWERVAQLGREAREQMGARCVVFADDKDDEANIQALARSIGSGTVIVHRLPLLQTAEILRRCSWALTNDSDLSWLAAAVRTPSLILFAPSTDRANRKPEGDRHQGVQAPVARAVAEENALGSLSVQAVRRGLESLQQALSREASAAGAGETEPYFEAYNVLAPGRRELSNNFKGPLYSCKSDAEFAESLSYVRRIFAGEVLVHRVRLDLSRACRFRCSFCFSTLDQAERVNLKEQCIPLDMAQDVCAEFKRLGVRIVNLYGGGEPTLNPHMSEIVGLFAREGMRIRIICNGSGLNAQLRNALIEHRAQIDIIRFSVPGLSSPSHRAMTRLGLFDLITSAIQEFARDVKRYPDAPEIGIYVPVVTRFSEGEIASFLEYAARSGIDWLFLREDTRAPSPPDELGSAAFPCAFPEVRSTFQQLAKAYPKFPVYYSTPRTAANMTSVCYFQLTDLILSYDSPTRSLVMVRCEHNIPGGISRLPPEGSYRHIGASSLYSVCEEQLRTFLANRVQACPRPDYCLSCRRNQAIHDQFVEEGRGDFTAGKIVPLC